MTSQMMIVRPRTRHFPSRDGEYTSQAFNATDGGLRGFIWEMGVFILYRIIIFPYKDVILWSICSGELWIDCPN